MPTTSNAASINNVLFLEAAESPSGIHAPFSCQKQKEKERQIRDTKQTGRASFPHLLSSWPFLQNGLFCGGSLLPRLHLPPRRSFPPSVPLEPGAGGSHPGRVRRQGAARRSELGHPIRRKSVSDVTMAGPAANERHLTRASVTPASKRHRRRPSLPKHRSALRSVPLHRSKSPWSKTPVDRATQDPEPLLLPLLLPPPLLLHFSAASASRDDARLGGECLCARVTDKAQGRANHNRGPRRRGGARHGASQGEGVRRVGTTTRGQCSRLRRQLWRRRARESLTLAQDSPRSSFWRNRSREFLSARLHHAVEATLAITKVMTAMESAIYDYQCPLNATIWCLRLEINSLTFVLMSSQFGINEVHIFETLSPGASFYICLSLQASRQVDYERDVQDTGKRYQFFSPNRQNTGWNSGCPNKVHFCSFAKGMTSKRHVGLFVGKESICVESQNHQSDIGRDNWPFGTH